MDVNNDDDDDDIGNGGGGDHVYVSVHAFFGQIDTPLPLRTANLLVSLTGHPESSLTGHHMVVHMPSYSLLQKISCPIY